MAFVVDTSAVIAWFIKDQATAHTNRLRERARREALHAPAVSGAQMCADTRAASGRSPYRTGGCSFALNDE